MKFLDGLIGAGHVRKRHLRSVLARQLGAGLAELHHPGATALSLAHHEPEETDEQEHREDADEEGPEEAVALDLVGVVVRDVLVDEGHEFRCAGIDELGAHLGRAADAGVLVGEGLTLLEVEVQQVGTREVGLLDLVGLDQLHGLGRGDLGIAAAAVEGEHRQGEGDDDEHPEEGCSEDALDVH